MTPLTPLTPFFQFQTDYCHNENPPLLNLVALSTDLKSRSTLYPPLIFRNEFTHIARTHLAAFGIAEKLG